MLADSKLPCKFWAEALSTCTYLRNRCPTKALKGITPYEAWNGVKPDLSLLRVFGCSAYAHVPKVERSKLDLKARKCVLLGYGTSQKGYRLYDVEHMKIVHSRDVVFDETSTPGLQRESTIKYVELEINEEPTVEYTVTSDSPDNVPEETAETEQLSEEIPSSPCIAIPHRSTREKDPTSVAEAKSASDNLEWEEAMRAKIESLHANEVWDLVMPPPNRKIVGSKWIFKRKVDADGTIERYKARLVYPIGWT